MCKIMRFSCTLHSITKMMDGNISEKSYQSPAVVKASRISIPLQIFVKKMKTKIGYFIKENLKHKLLIRIPVAVASDTGKVDKYEKGALRWVCQNVFN